MSDVGWMSGTAHGCRVAVKTPSWEKDQDGAITLRLRLVEVVHQFLPVRVLKLWVKMA